MKMLLYILQKTVGQKIIIGLTGLGLCLFVLIHMLGNLFILSGPDAYNRYAHNLHEMPVLVFFEIGLLIVFAGHIVLSLLLVIKNKKAALGTPAKPFAKGEKQISLLHRFLWLQGGVLLLFLGLHLLSFKFGPYYETDLDGHTVRDIYRLVLENFKKPIYTAGYSLALLLLSVHLLRGLPASFKSLGLNHPLYVSLVEKLSLPFALLLTLGFLAPIWYVFIWL